MRLRSSVLVVGLITTVLCFTVVGKGEDTKSADEAAIRQNVQYLESGWNQKSGELFAKGFAEDADYVVINGMYIKGRKVIESAHQRIFDTIYKDTKISLTVKQIRFLRPDVVVVHVSGNRVWANDASRNDEAMITVVMTKEKGTWTISAFQNTGVEPPRP